LIEQLFQLAGFLFGEACVAGKVDEQWFGGSTENTVEER
jgi:hypothetical protein